MTLMLRRNGTRLLADSDYNDLIWVIVVIVVVVVVVVAVVVMTAMMFLTQRCRRRWCC
jgi:hypothetical protein